MGSEVGGDGLPERGQHFPSRPGGTRRAKEDELRMKQKEGASYAQAQAIEKIAEAQMRKARHLEDQNLLLLITTDETKLGSTEARKYVRLRKTQELRKLRRQLAEEEERRVDAMRARRAEAAWPKESQGEDRVTKKTVPPVAVGEGSEQTPIRFHEGYHEHNEVVSMGDLGWVV